MISPNQIARMIEIGSYGRLIGRILSNGRCESRHARQRLEEPTVRAVAAIGLALQRFCELTYGPSAAGAGMARRLIGMQRADGLFGGGPSAPLAASAVALKGLLAWRRQIQADGQKDESLDGVIQAGVVALAAALEERRFAEQDAADVEVVIWQLGREVVFRRAAGDGALAELLDRLTDHRHDAVAVDDLARFAHAAAA